MDYVKNLIANEIPDSTLLDPTVIICDPAIAGGQIISLIEKRMLALGISESEVCRRVYGYETDSIARDYAYNINGLKGNYSVSSYEEHEYKTANVIVGNPPYNDGTAARNPIYHTFLENFSKVAPDYTYVVVQANWLTQPDKKLGKSVRDSLRKLGVYKIVINPDDTF